MPLNFEDIQRLKRIEEATLTVDFEGYEPLNAPFDAIFKQNKRRISPKDQQLLRQGLEDPHSDRSNALFALGGRLLERGVPFDHAYVLLQGSPVNKFQGRSDEVQRLYEGLKKVEQKSKVRVLKPKNSDTLPWQDDNEFRAAHFEPPRYQVEGVWVDGSKGFIAAEPKCGKSTFAFDLALSVSTGTPFLGHFEVHRSGRVFVIQEEMDTGDVQWRRKQIMKSKGFTGEASVTANDDGTFEVNWGANADIAWLNESQFKLDDEDHREALEEKVRRERPVMIIFDPLQRMLGPETNINSSSNMNQIFEWLDHIRRTYRTSIVLVHHLKKPAEGLGYDDQFRLLGSQALASWYESMLMLTRKDSIVRVRPTFRSKHNQPFTVQIDWGMEEDPMYSAEVQGMGAKSQAENLLELVQQNPGISIAEAAEALGKSQQGIGKQADRLKLRTKLIKPKKGTGGGRPVRCLYVK